MSVRSKAAGVLAAALLPLFLCLSCFPARERVQVMIKEQPFSVEVVRSEKDRQQGLMHRKALKPGEGMLFIFESDRILTFWMKDTSIPLSLAFLSNQGEIMEILAMKPFSLKPVSSRHYVRYALELPSGAFAEIGAGPGDRVVFPKGFRR